jgi:hypothetical protein
MANKIVHFLLGVSLASLCNAASPPIAMALQHLISETGNGGHAIVTKPSPPDPEILKKAAATPKLNLKESWNRQKTTLLPQLKKGPPLFRLREFVFSSIMKTKDFILDNSGNIIYKSLPYVIALLHLPIFKHLTSGTPAIE